MNTDFDVPSEVGEIHVEVTPDAPDAGSLLGSLDFVLGGRRDQGCVDRDGVLCLPLSFSIQPHSARPANAATRVLIVARRIVGGATRTMDVVERSAVISFQPGRSLAYGVFLPKACASGRDICRARGLVCTERGCESEQVGDDQLVPFTPGMEHPIARAPNDGGPDFDARSTDASVDSGSDSSDAGRPAQNYSLSVGVDHSCVLNNRTGQLHCWGDNDYGQLGQGFVTASVDGGSTGIATPVTPILPDGGALPRFAGMVAGRSTTCAYTASSELYCWGNNNSIYTSVVGEVAPTPSRVLGLTPPAGASIQGINAVNGAHFVRYSDGTVNSFGARYDSASADGPDNVGPAQRAPGAGSIAELNGSLNVHSANSSVGFATDGASRLLGWGHIHAQRLGSLMGEVISAMPERRVVTRPTLIPMASPVQSAFASDATTIALLADGRVACWGENESYVVDPTAASGLQIATPVVRADIGGGHTAVAIVGPTGLALNGTDRIDCFGARYNHVCPNEGSLMQPSRVRGFTGPAPRFIDVQGGFDFACALTDDDRVFCWGGNGWSQCGAPASAFIDATAPHQVPLP